MTDKYLIRDDGVIFGWTEALSKNPRLQPYVPPVVKIEPMPEPKNTEVLEALDSVGTMFVQTEESPIEPVFVKTYPPIDLEYASRAECVAYAKENFGVDLKPTNSLTKLRSEVSALLG